MDGYHLESVRLGEWNIETVRDCSPDDKTYCNEHISVKVSNIILHKKFRNAQSYHNDIALLQLAEGVNYTNFIKPICLPLNQALWTADLTGKRFDIGGWGEYKAV